MKRRWAFGLQAALAVMLWWAAPERGWAQVDTTGSDIRIIGTMRDSASGQPVNRAEVCTIVRSPDVDAVRSCAVTDTLGQFSLENQPAGTYTVQSFCWGRRFIGSQTRLGIDTLTFTNGTTTELHLVVDAEGCDQRRLKVLNGRFVGHYSYGFELSSFTWADHPGMNIWVEFGNVDFSEWPDSDESYPCVYVEWAGELLGPGYYGHMSGAEYRLAVDSVQVVETADPDRCERTGAEE